MWESFHPSVPWFPQLSHTDLYSLVSLPAFLGRFMEICLSIVHEKPVLFTGLTVGPGGNPSPLLGGPHQKLKQELRPTGACSEDRARPHENVPSIPGGHRCKKTPRPSRKWDPAEHFHVLGTLGEDGGPPDGISGLGSQRGPHTSSPAVSGEL